MNREFFQQDRTQLLIFAVAVVALIVAGYLWALFGDASQVTPIPPATPESSPVAVILPLI